MNLKNLQLKIYKEFNPEIEKIWENFEKNSHNYFFQTLNWQKEWFYSIMKHNNNYSINIIVVKNNEDILFILPFCIKKFFTFKILMWAGYPFSDYNAPLIKKNLELNREDFLYIWKKIIEIIQFDINCVDLQNQPEKIKDMTNPFFDYLSTKDEYTYHSLILKNFTNINKSQIADIKYQYKRLNNKSSLLFKFAENSEEQKKVLNFIIKNKVIQYQSTNAWNIFQNLGNRFFFLNGNLNLRQNLSISYISYDDEIIAAHLGYIYLETFYYLFPAYNLKYKKYSPGKILLNFLINHCKLNGINYFDFTIGSETYKKNWSNYQQKGGITLNSLNIIGDIYISYFKFKNKIKSFNQINFLKKIYNRIK